MKFIPKKAIRRTAAALTVLLGLVIFIECLSICLAGAHTEQMYTRELAASALRDARPVFLCWLAAVLASAASGKVNEPEMPINEARQLMRPCGTVRGRLRTVRWLLFVLAAVFIIAGSANGGRRDVLVKAINICTECIGLG